jgi:hypothetical protein
MSNKSKTFGVYFLGLISGLVISRAAHHHWSKKFDEISNMKGNGV